MLGEEHPHTLSTMAKLVSMYRYKGRWKDAEELGVRMMKTMKRVGGEEDLNTLSSIANLAFSLKYLRRNAEAILLMKRCGELGCKSSAQAIQI